MKRVLFLLPTVPDPPDAGARLRNLGLLRLAGQRCEVDAIAFGGSGDEARLGGLARRVAVVPAGPTRGATRRVLGAVQSDLPDLAERCWSADYLDTVREFVCNTRYDAVQAEGVEVARYLELAPPAQRIYDAHNAEFLLQQRASEVAPGFVARAYSRVQAQRLRRFEARVAAGSRLTLAVSEHDANQLRALTDGLASVAVVPNGLDVASYPFRTPGEHDIRTVLFVGKLDYRPNAEALRWLLDGVLPRVPDVRLFAVGAAPPSWLVQVGQHDPRVAVTGYVADERPYLRRATALVLPLRVAGGSRLKALVALASGVPIVSTALGMEGLEAEAGRHYVRAESEDEWVAALTRVLADPAERVRLASAGRELVETCYDWAAIKPAFDSAYERIGV